VKWGRKPNTHRFEASTGFYGPSNRPNRVLEQICSLGKSGQPPGKKIRDFSTKNSWKIMIFTHFHWKYIKMSAPWSIFGHNFHPRCPRMPIFYIGVAYKLRNTKPTRIWTKKNFRKFSSTFPQHVVLLPPYRPSVLRGTQHKVDWKSEKYLFSSKTKNTFILANSM